MRIAIVSDIHGNRTALDAVLADLRLTSPDLILHGGDLPHGGSSPREIVDRIRDLGWPGVAGNTDEMLWKPESLKESSGRSSTMQTLYPLIEEMAAATREALGEERIKWLSELPLVQTQDQIALTHATPASMWQAPLSNASDAELESAYQTLGQPIVVYGHIHHPYVRKIPNVTVINTGSVSLSYDGDPRAVYLLLDAAKPKIRRVEYDVEQEIKELYQSGTPHADWYAKILRSGRFQMP